MHEQSAMESFDAGDDRLLTEAGRTRWLHPLRTIMMLAVLAFLLDFFVGHRLTSWRDTLISNAGAVLMIVAILYVYVGIRDHRNPPA